MVRSVHNVPKSDKNLKVGKAGKEGLEGVTKKKRKPPVRPKRTEAERAQRKIELRRIKKRVIIDAQAKDATIPKATIQRIVKACVRNWTSSPMQIHVNAIEMIRQHAEFIVNRALKDTKQLMMNSTRGMGVQVLDRHVTHVIKTNEFYKKATTIPFSIY